ncbi:hypothetical protein DSM104329_01000 [Capillimicrobium parvum]|uniref:Uncharacterized protein n=1 Tax=Capillimicrobium parvum TaxID=2884022 RepID=A0A9E7BYT1_9ACTN|nr:hypothetical protein DSM104329_01000 [Capillimicrobium parvum]
MGDGFSAGVPNLSTACGKLLQPDREQAPH